MLEAKLGEELLLLELSPLVMLLLQVLLVLELGPPELEFSYLLQRPL
jgi:hypothetical protein